MQTGRPAPSLRSAVVTGANGFIGRALLKRLAADGVTVTASSRRPMSHPDLAGPVVVGDIDDADFARTLLERSAPDVVFHLAARVTGARSVTEVGPTLLSNLVGSVNVLEAATEVDCGRVVLIGSGDEPTGAAAACSPYAAAKACQAVYAAMFHSLYGTPVATARVFMAYGPEQPDESKLIPYVITSLLRGTAPRLAGGFRRCDWVYVDDVVDALVAIAGAADVDGRTIDIGTGRLHTVRQVVDTIVESLDTSAALTWGAVPERPQEVERSADLSAARTLLGWSPSVDLATGLQRTVAWYADRQNREGKGKTSTRAAVTGTGGPPSAPSATG